MASASVSASAAGAAHDVHTGKTAHRQGSCFRSRIHGRGVPSHRAMLARTAISLPIEFTIVLA